MFSFVFWQIVKYFLYMLLGFGLGKAGRLPRETSTVLSRLLLYLMLPSAIFQSFCQNFTIPYLTEGLSLIALGLLTSGLQIVAATVLGRRLPRDTYTQNVCIAILAIPNTSYVGTPLVLELFGTKTLMQMMLFTIPLTVYCNTEGYRLLVGKEKSGRAGPAESGDGFHAGRHGVRPAGNPHARPCDRGADRVQQLCFAAGHDPDGKHSVRLPHGRDLPG